MFDEANTDHDGCMIDIIAAVFWSLVFLAAVAIWVKHLVDHLRSDGYGVVPPPRSHHHELTGSRGGEQR
jgi:hypothetical protein